MDGGLLDIACARIAELRFPAFIKDSQLRYVAVNPAYARFFGRPVAAFPGCVSGDFSGDGHVGQREEHERRTLVFGTEETAPVTAPDGGRYHMADVERFITDDDRFYIFGVMQAAADVGVTEGRADDVRENARPEATRPETTRPETTGPDATGFSDPYLVGQAFDFAGIGIAIFDERGRIVYQNTTQRGFYGHVLHGLDTDDTLRDVLGRFWDAGIFGVDEPHEEKEAWIRQRIASHETDDHDHVDLMPDGRFIRVTSRCLGNGYLLVVTNDVSQAKRQESQLREQVRATEIYRSTLEGLPVAVFLRDRAGRMTYANGAYERLLGKDRSIFMGLNEREMFPEFGKRFQVENTAVIDDGEPLEKSEELVFGDDRPVPIITRLRRIEAPDGEPFVVGSITDVSVLKARENQLLEAQGHADKLHGDLDTILQSLPVGIMILDEDFLVESVNAAFSRLWGPASTFDLIGTHYRDFVRINFERGSYDGISDDFEAVYRSRVERFSGDNEEPQEVQTPEGRVLLIGNKSLSNGKYLLTYFDITAVREREREAREAREALERLGGLWGDATRVMSQGLLIMREGRIVMSNDALPDMLHVPEAMLEPGEPWSALLDFLCERGDLGGPEEAAGVQRMFSERVPRGESLSASFLADGRNWVLFESNLSSRDHWIAVFTDVTELKQREEELTRLLERAEAADRAKSEFLANMSHEIRTPMNGVLGMAELLAKSNLDTRQKTFTDIIVKSGNALLTIINDILDFSKIDAGQMKLRSMPFDPVEAIEDVASLLSTSAAAKDIDLVVRGASANRRLVLGDAGRFRQIVTNLVGNAVKFTEKGHVIIDFDFQPLDDGRQALALTVADTGIGIPEGKLDAIFETFSQVDTSSTRRHEGTGLGLSITAGLVSLFGGEIGVESVQGQGSRFSVRLPFSILGEKPQPRPLPANVHGAHVLIVDDNEVNRNVLVEQLSGWGFDACATASGAEAFSILDAARLANVPVDAMIIDFPMNGDDAAAIAGQVRDDPHYAGIPVIFLTSIEAADREGLFAALNVQAHLMKPPRADLLRAAVVDVVRSARLQRQVQQGVEALEPVAPRPLAPLPFLPSLFGGGEGLDILVAEDNEVNQIVFTQILQRTGLSFRIVQNGREAVEAWRTDAPALILMDVSMPEMNGHQATRLIRHIEHEEGLGLHVPIIGVTAHALERDCDLCLESGMDDYLSKPISPELLESKIRRWISIFENPAGERTEGLS